jgi:hypothetical protein
MPDAEVLSYTVTPGPEVLAKMGTSWTLFTMPPVMFTVGPDGEPPEPATVTMTAEQAADLASSGYVLEEALSNPEPVNDVQVSPGLEGVEPAPVPLTRESLERALDRPLTLSEAGAVGVDAGVFVGTGENMPGLPSEGFQVEPGAQADGSPAEPIRRRKT